MKNFLLFVTLIVVGNISGQRTNHNIKPPPAVAILCGNIIVPHAQKNALFEQMQAEGCEDIHFLHVGNGHYLGYGTRVLIGE